MDTDTERAVTEVTAKLHTRGVEIASADTPEEIVNILEAVERFERAVTGAGGDLMVAEPPRDGHAARYTRFTRRLRSR